MTVLGDLVDTPIARGRGADPAVIWNDTTWSFADLSDRSAVYRDLAVNMAPEKRLGMVGENHPDWIAAYYGVPDAGRTLCFLNHRLSPTELCNQIERANVATVVASASERSRLEPSVSSGGRAVTLISFAEVAPRVGQTPAPLSVPDETDPAWLLFTSGTTGVPKGALLSHQGILAALHAGEAARPISPDDVFLFPFPLCHVAGYNVLRLHQHGRPVVLMERFDAAHLVDLVERHQVTSATMAATMLSAVCDHIEEDPRQVDRLASLGVLAYGASPMPAELLERADRLLNVRFTQGYGMTELSGNAVFLDADDHRRALRGDRSILRAAGRPGQGVEVAVHGPDDRPVAPGATGEIVVRAPQVMVGYLDDPDATTAALRDGWLHTGDGGRWRDDGLLEVVDRLKDVIISGGENVGSLEVEETIRRVCPEITSVAVVGLPDPRWGENVCAIVTLAPGLDLDLDLIMERLDGILAPFKIPRHLVVVDVLPLTHSGKVAKAHLRSWLAEDPSVAGPRHARRKR